jgi:hypothetical protein
MQVLYRDPVLVLATYDEIFFQCWRDEGGVAQVQRMYEEHLRFVSARPERTTLSMAHLTMPGVRPPEDGLRVYMNKHGKEVTPRVRRGVTVIEAGGFAGAVVRGVVSGLTLLSRGPKQEVRRDPLDGLRYLLADRPPGAAPVDAETLFATYRETVST